MARRSIPLPPVPEPPNQPLILARVYPGHHEAAMELFQEDAENLALYGYVPVAQSYAEGRYSTLSVAIAVVLVIFGIGVLMLIYMAAVRPPGTLAATYELRVSR